MKLIFIVFFSAHVLHALLCHARSEELPKTRGALWIGTAIQTPLFLFACAVAYPEGVFLAWLGPLSPAPAFANENWRVLFEIENDVLVGADRHYSNGLLLSVLAPGRVVPAWVAATARALPPYDDDPKDVRWGVSKTASTGKPG